MPAKPTTPSSMVADAQGQDAEFMQDHMYRLDALKLMAQSGISKPSEQDIKATVIKLKEQDEAKQQAAQQQQQQLAAQQQAALAQRNAAQPNLVAPPQPAAAMIAPSAVTQGPPSTGVAGPGGPPISGVGPASANIQQALAAMLGRGQQNPGGPQ